MEPWPEIWESDFSYTLQYYAAENNFAERIGLLLQDPLFVVHSQNMRRKLYLLYYQMDSPLDAGLVLQFNLMIRALDESLQTISSKLIESAFISSDLYSLITQFSEQFIGFQYHYYISERNGPNTSKPLISSETLARTQLIFTGNPIQQILSCLYGAFLAEKYLLQCRNLQLILEEQEALSNRTQFVNFALNRFQSSVMFDSRFDLPDEQGQLFQITYCKDSASSQRIYNVQYLTQTMAFGTTEESAGNYVNIKENPIIYQRITDTSKFPWIIS